MRKTGRQASIVATPVLIGTVTVLVVIVAVFLAYNANTGLPFVPTFDVRAEIPGGANLVEGNDVRVGGFRVGAVERIRPKVDPKSGETIAVVDMKLDKTIEPVPKDSRVYVRPRSNLGLKYVQVTLGHSKENLRPGDALSLANATKPIELDEFLSTFDEEMRENQQRALEGFGNALAGRGESINIAIREFVPFFTHLTPVMTALSDPTTRLNEFFRATARFAGEVAPVAGQYAQLFGNMATTFEALGRDENALRATIERGPPTLDAGIRSFPVQRPFLADSETLFRHLRPVAVEMEESLPAVTDALHTGRPVLRRSPPFYRRTENVFNALHDLAAEPSTLMGLKDLTTTVKVVAPLIEYVAPYQTVCNYWLYYWTAIGEHVSESVRGGVTQRVNLKSDNRTQANRMSTSEGVKPADVAKSENPKTAEDPEGNPLTVLHRQAYEPAIDAQGNADCQVGQRGYLDGPLVEGNRYPPSDDPAKLGGSHVVLDSDIPGVSGPTYKGVPNLSDVP